jgi:hypothetical protein
MSPFVHRRLVPLSEGRAAVASVSVETCPECGAVLPPGQLDAHLRGQHRLYRFRGILAPVADTLAAVLADLSRPDPSPGADELLDVITRDEYARRAGRPMASALGAALAAVEASRRAAVCDAVARVLAAGAAGQAIARYLAAEPEAAAQQLALALAVRLRPPVEPRLVRALKPLLSDRRLAPEAQLAAAAALLTTTGREGKEARRVLKALIARRSKLRSVARLRQLGALTGPFPRLDEITREVEDRVRMRCPRCDVQMRRREMVAHLWNEHRLLLHGERVRDPWQLIEEWVESGVRQGDAGALERARDLARQIDARAGPRRVQRLIAARGGNETEIGRALLDAAAEHQATLCPHCYELVPVPREAPPREPSLWRGRLSVHGYRVEVSEAGLVPVAEVETPGAPCDRYPVAGRRWTQKGATLFLVTPLVLLALAVAIFGPTARLLLPVTTLLGMALALSLAARFGWRPRRRAEDRVVDYAWTRLAPRLHAEGFSLADSAFLASLALASVGRGRPAARREALTRLLALSERVVTAGFGTARHLAALRRLAIADAVRAGQDRVRLVAAEVGRCFGGKLPLAYAEGVLAGRPEERWERGDRARLRVLLCDAAFEAGFELRDLIEAGETAPALGGVLRTDDTEALAHLRLLWSLRASRPWDRVGEAVSVFEAAGEAGAAELLGRQPDLLLRHPLPPRFGTQAEGGAAHILTCSHGVVLRGAVFTRPPLDVAVATRDLRHELVVDGRHFLFDSDPEPVASRLERWCRYHFEEFLPATGDVHRWRSPHATAVLRAWGTVRCPDCGRPLLPRVGGVGVALEGG